MHNSVGSTAHNSDAPQRRPHDNSAKVLQLALKAQDDGDKSKALELLIGMVQTQAREHAEQRAASPPASDTMRAPIPDTATGSHPSPSTAPPLFSFSLTQLRRVGALVVVCLALLQPLATALAGSYFGANDVATKLNEVLVAQAEAEAASTQDRQDLLEIAAFIVDSEDARRKGTELPAIPTMLRLKEAQAKYEKTTGQ